MRVAKVIIDGTSYPLIFNATVLEWARDNNIDIDNLKIKGTDVMPTFRLIHECIRQGVKYAKVKGLPEYDQITAPPSWDDFLFLTGMTDLEGLSSALLEAITGVRTVDAELKKSPEADGEAPTD